MAGATIRVVQLIQELRTGGAERVVATLCRALADHGHEVAVIAAPGEVEAEIADRLARPRYPLPVVARRPTRIPEAMWRVRRALADFRPDVVHAHNPVMALLLAGAGWRGRRGLVSVHGVPDTDWRRTIRLLRLPRLPVIACGPGVAAALTDAGRPPSAVIPNGVDPPPPPADRARLLAEWGLPPDSRIVMVVGRLEPPKNQQLAIRALTGLAEEVRLVLVGEGSQRTRLAALAGELGVAHRVVFAGLRPGRPLMPAADVICLPSRSEGMPLVAAEAMVAGVPLVVTAVRGNRELVEHGRTGLVVPPEDPSALAAAIGSLLTQPELAERLGAAARQAASPYTSAAMVEGYLEWYRRVS